LADESVVLPVPDWDAAIERIVGSGGVAMVVGNVDAGKTSFCARLASAGVAAGVATAVVDADIGQSEIGAPGTIGMALVDKEITALGDLKPRRLYFVGSTTPVGHMLESAAGTRKMVDEARAAGARLVVTDTSGLVSGHVGRKLKTYKADLLRPDYIVGIQKQREIEHVLIPFSRVEWANVIRLAVSDQARRKPPELRAARRQMNFYRHFHDAPGHIIRFDEVCTWNTWLLTGRLMKWQYVKFIEDALKCRALHVEVVGSGILIVSEKSCRAEGRAALEEQFKTREITIVPAESYGGLLVGLADKTGATLSVGLIQAIDFKHRSFFVLSPLKSASPVKIVQFGSIRLQRDGRELGLIRPGEV